MESSRQPAFDVVVAGAGPVALALAASLAALPGGNALRIALVDPQAADALADPVDDGREIALNDRSVAMLDRLGAWAAIPPDEIAPLRRMRVLNGPSSHALQFGQAYTDGEAMGRFAPNHWLRRSLHGVVAGLPNVVLMPGRRLLSAQSAGGDSRASLSDGSVLRARLVVAADTRRSALRDQQRIPAALHDYRQRMLVCPVAHPLPHAETATAWFEYGRTLVTLPLNGGRSSLVMTLPEADAAALLAMDDDAFGQEATRRYHGRLGPMRPVGRRHVVPVVTAYAGRFVARRFALVGDAAIGMHPTTAHGFNFGLLGQRALADALAASVAAGGDLGDPAPLARYEQAHRRETQGFFLGAEALMRLYAGGDSWPGRLLRDAALRVGALPPLRRALEARMRAPGPVGGGAKAD